MKTPEEMAEEYCGTTGWLEDDYVWRETKAGFLAGYKAAKKLYAAKLQEADDTIDGMVDECEGLKTIIYDNEQTNLPTSAKWISVKDRLPEYTPMVLAMCTDGYELAYYGMYGQGWTNTLGTEHLNVTHWHSLPAPPKEEG